MSRRFRWIIIILVIGFSLYYMLPLNQKVNLGLDLQGGMHLVLSVDTEKAVEGRLDSIVYQLRQELQSEKIAFTFVDKTLPNSVTVGVDSTTDTRKLNTIIENFQLSSSGRAGDNLRFTLRSDEIARIKEFAVSQSLEIISNRVNGLGVTEPVIQKQGVNQIVVQLPGITDPKRAEDLIGQTAQLKFYIVDNTATEEQLRNKIPPYGSIILEMREYDRVTRKVTGYVPLALKNTVVLTGDNLIDARVGTNEFNESLVTFEFDRTGARIFTDLTAKNIGKQLAIVLDDTIYSAPNINERIPGGKGSITGAFTFEEAKDLATVLRAGSLPAPVKIEENRTVGASLGQDAIRSGVKASIIGLAFIMLFMLIYYKLSGLVANIGLMCNFVVLLGILCALKATLTLPGIAGVILTLGIAVDSNVLIFERIREELRNKRTVLNAFEVGYNKAFSTIVDANVTSLIAALVLFQFGTGPVKGFAVTLSIGLLASMFTAVFITKTVFMEFILRQNSQKISI